MIKGIGNDIIEVARLQAAIKRQGQRFLDEVFTSVEQDYCLKHTQSERHFAGRFAAKEAILKAFGTGLRQGISWLDIEITNDERGKPCVKLSEKLEAKFHSPQLMISISHCKEYATAFAVFL